MASLILDSSTVCSTALSRIAKRETSTFCVTSLLNGESKDDRWFPRPVGSLWIGSFGTNFGAVASHSVIFQKEELWSVKFHPFSKGSTSYQEFFITCTRRLPVLGLLQGCQWGLWDGPQLTGGWVIYLDIGCGIIKPYALTSVESCNALRAQLTDRWEILLGPLLLTGFSFNPSMDK